jgi:carbon-monoxide dehydrogenase medium subunit
VKPAKFDYFRADTTVEAVEALSANPDSKIMAGGQSLVPLMNMRLAVPSALVDISRVAELSGIDANGALRIGAVTSQRDVLASTAVQQGWPLITAALRHVGHPATRARGTFGGSVAHADPAAELPAVMLALDATITVTGASGRSVPAEGFFAGPFTTTMADDELLAEVSIPDMSDRFWGFGEVVRRRGDYALTGAAVSLRADGEGNVTDARVALFSVSGTAVRAASAEAGLVGTQLGSEDAAARAGQAALDGVEIAADSFVSAGYRRDATAAVVKRALLEAATNPRGTSHGS